MSCSCSPPYRYALRYLYKTYITNKQPIKDEDHEPLAAYRHWYLITSTVYLITVYLITVPEYHGCSGGYSGVHSVHRGVGCGVFTMVRQHAQSSASSSYAHVMTPVRLIKPISLSVTLFLFQSSAPLHAEDKEDKEGKARGGGGGRRASHPEVHITKDLKRTCLYVFVFDSVE